MINTKKPRNFLLTENFNLYDTMRITEIATTSSNPRNPPRKPSKSLVFSQSRFFSTDRVPANPQLFPKTRGIPANFPRFPAKISATPYKFLEIATTRAKSPGKLLPTAAELQETVETPDKSAKFLRDLAQRHDKERKLRVFRNFKTNSMHLDLGDVKVKKSSTFFNVFSDFGQRNSLIKDLSARLFRNDMRRSPGKVREKPGLSRKISRFPTKTDRNCEETPNSLDFLLKTSDFFEHQLLLTDIIKAVRALQSQRNAKFCVKTLGQILGNCPILLKSLIDSKENQVFEPLTPRSLYFRLSSPGSSTKKPANRKLDEHFVRLLVDFKARLQESAIHLQNERFSLMKQSILKEYGVILDKELGILQKNKGKSAKKYEKMKKDLKKRLKITALSGGSTLSWSLRKCEDNCGDLLHVDKVAKTALHEFESTVFAIKARQNQMIESIN